MNPNPFVALNHFTCVGAARAARSVNLSLARKPRRSQSTPSASRFSETPTPSVVVSVALAVALARVFFPPPTDRARVSHRASRARHSSARAPRSPPRRALAMILARARRVAVASRVGVARSTHGGGG